MNTGKCKECGCTTGGGDYCYEHSPRIIWPLKDGSWYEDKNGQRTHCWTVAVEEVVK